MKRIALSCLLSGCTPPLEAARVPQAEPETVVPVEPSAPQQTPDAFHVVATLEPPRGDEQTPHFRIFEVDGAVLVTAGPRLIPVADDGSLQIDRTWLRGIDPSFPPGRGSLVQVLVWDAMVVGGRWPDALYMTVSAESFTRGEPFPTLAYQREGDRWVQLRTKGGWFPTHIAPWRDGSVLALKGYRADAKSRPPKQPLTVLRGSRKAPDLGRREITAMDAVDSGEIVAVIEGERPLALHFDPASGKTTELPLPGPRLGLPYVYVQSPTRAWVYGRNDDENGPWLARFDGEAWTTESTPACPDGIGSLSVTADGEVWIVCGFPPEIQLMEGGSVWRRHDREPWQEVELPKDFNAAEVLARASDDVWIAGSALLHTRPRKQAIVVPDLESTWTEIREMQGS